MLESIFSSAELTLPNMLICSFASIIFGIGTACIYMYKNNYNRNFVITLSLLPAIVQTVIMLVNGSLGTGVAVLGAFSLVRFRSIPGGSREICSIFLAMALGLASSMGYLLFAAIFLLIVGAVTVTLTLSHFGDSALLERDLRITIPEDLDYCGIFDDLFAAFTKKSELIKVKTTNMGSLFELRYRIVLKNARAEKRFIDELRCRNGNLTIICGRASHGEEL